MLLNDLTGIGLEVIAKGDQLMVAPRNQLTDQLRDCIWTNKPNLLTELRLLEATCDGLDITPTEMIKALAPGDIDYWCRGKLSTNTLLAFAHSLVQRRFKGENSHAKNP
jgi:hypothetical protein